MDTSRWILAGLLAAVAGCATESARVAATDADYGVLVMAHGGSRQWDAAVLNAVSPLRREFPVAVAFGMADAASLQEAVAELESRGVREIGVVRLFVSGDSFLDRTEQILGLRVGAPSKPVAAADQHDHAGHGMALWRIDTTSTFAVSAEGLNEAPEMGAILLDRARALSRDPAREDVLVLAHGPGDDPENERWLAHIDRLAEQTRSTLPFHRVQVATLREDWPEKRVAAERAVRQFIESSRAAGRRTLVVPFRVEGFGPYAEVLEGLDYSANELGLLPHGNVTDWIRRQAIELRSADFSGTATPRAAP
jgi:sirohydrochlorin cobaltochelatase